MVVTGEMELCDDAEPEMLKPSELRRLQEIEQGLRMSDPEFAEMIDAGTPRSGSALARPLYVMMVLGVVVGLFGLLAPVLYAVGLSLTLTAVLVRLAISWLDRRGLSLNDEDPVDEKPVDEDSTDEDDPGTGPVLA